MEPGPIVARGAMNLDEIYLVRREEIRRFFGDSVTSWGEAVLRDGLDGILGWLPTHGRFVGRFPGGLAANTALSLSRPVVPVALCGAPATTMPGRQGYPDAAVLASGALDRDGAAG